MKNVRVTGISIKDLGCIEYREIEIGANGVEIKGPCGTGKTTIGDAIEMTLVGKGVSKKAIRRGAERAEVLVHCDATPEPPFTARRVIPSEGRTTITVRNDNGDTRPWQDGATKLAAIFGSLFDPSRFLKAPPAERLEMLTELLPMPLTAADLERWTGTVEEFDEGRHGLEVIDAVRGRYYAQRTDAKKALKEAEAAYKLAEDEAERLSKPEHKGVEVGEVGAEDVPVRAAEGELAALKRRAVDAEAQQQRTHGTRERIAKLRAEHEAMLAGAPEVPLSEWTAANGALAAQKAEVARIEEMLRAAERALEPLQAVVNDLANRQDAYNTETAKAARLYDQARELEQTLAETAIAPPEADELVAAERSIAVARARADLVRAARAAGEAMHKMVAMGDEVAAAKREVQRLEGIVERLTNDAPAEMVARAKAIPGLAIVDGDIYLDGVAFDRCGGAEQRHFAVLLAKRANPEGKLIKMDEVGSLDDRTRAALYEEVIADGWSIISFRPWCDPDQDLAEPVVVPIRSAVEEARTKKAGR